MNTKIMSLNILLLMCHSMLIFSSNKEIIELNSNNKTYYMLMSAAKYGTPEDIEEIMSSGDKVNINYQDKESRFTPLVASIAYKNFPCTEKILEYDPALNLPDYLGRNALLYAIIYNQPVLVNLLLANGALFTFPHCGGEYVTIKDKISTDLKQISPEIRNLLTKKSESYQNYRNNRKKLLNKK